MQRKEKCLKHKDNGEGIICEIPRGTGESYNACLLTFIEIHAIGLAQHLNERSVRECFVPPL